MLPKDSNVTDRERVIVDLNTGDDSPRVFEVKRLAVEALNQLNNNQVKTKFNWHGY